MEGWIKLHRGMLTHWLYDEYRPLTRREAWENLIMWANFKADKALIHGQLIDCERGQLLYSIETYSKKFVWSVGQVKSFFKLLENDGMIKLEGLKYTTRLTICNYDKYQDLQLTESELRANSELTESELTTNSELQDKNEKKEKNDKNEKNNTAELSENENSEHTSDFSLKEFKGKELKKIQLEQLPEEYRQSHSISLGFYALFKEINEKMGLSSTNIKTPKFDGYTLEIYRMLKQGEANKETLRGIYAYLKWELENIEGDKFRWCEQIRSCSNLRKHYPQIFTAMKKAQIKLNGKSQNWDEIDKYLKEHKIEIVNTKKL